MKTISKKHGIFGKDNNREQVNIDQIVKAKIIRILALIILIFILINLLVLLSPWKKQNNNHNYNSNLKDTISETKIELENIIANPDVSNFDFAFNKIEAIVNTPSNYVLLNQPYRAEVFLAASDTTQAPEIYLTTGGAPLRVKNGKGIYNGNTSSIGIKRWEGVIKYTDKTTGSILEFPFQREYMVGAPAVTILPTKMNVFYIGLDNPLEISATGVPASNISVSLSGAGTIQKISNSSYVARVKSPGEVKINVSVKIGESVKSLGSMSFRCQRVPNPTATVAGKTGGKISKSTLTSSGVKANIENFQFSLSFPIVSFTVATNLNGFDTEEKSNGSKLTTAQKQLINQAKTGQKIYFEDIKCKAPDGSVRTLGTLKFVIK